MLRLAFDFIITWRETRTRPNAYFQMPSPAKVKRLVWKRHLSVLIWRRSDDL